MVRASIIRHVRGRFEVREEADGEAGWQTLLVDPTIQAVITDIGMPRLDGYGLLERMRSSRLSRINTLPVVVISGRRRARGAHPGQERRRHRLHLQERQQCRTAGPPRRRSPSWPVPSATSKESRAALATGQPLSTPTPASPRPPYLHHHASQELAAAQRHQGELSVQVIEIDQFEGPRRPLWRPRGPAGQSQALQDHGHQAAQGGHRRRAGAGALCGGSPATSMNGAQALRCACKGAIDHIVMTYRRSASASDSRWASPPPMPTRRRRSAT